MADYVSRMKEGQDKIYYLLAPTPEPRRQQPAPGGIPTEGRRGTAARRGDRQLAGQQPARIDGKQWQSATQSDADLSALDDETEAEARKQAGEDYAALTAKLKEALDGKAWDVRVSTRLTDSPSCIVGNGPDLSFALVGGPMNSGLPAQPILEINPQHPLVQRLNAHQDDPHFADWAQVLHQQAVLTMGARIEDPAAFVRQLNHLLVALADSP